MGKGSNAEVRAEYPTMYGKGDAGRWCPTGRGDGTHVPPSKTLGTLLAEAAASKRPVVSFEYFPPKTADGVKNLYDRLERMTEEKPLFIDFTWGAGGSTSELTVELAATAKARFGVDVNMHLTCTNMEMEKTQFGLTSAARAGVRNICALRGDPPLGQEKWVATDGGFTCALDLVKYIRARYGDHFGVSVSGYPEGHPEVIKPASELGRPLTAAEEGRAMVTAEGVTCVCSDEDYEKEMAYLKEKVDAGADCIITQLFYDVDVFVTFVHDCRARGITVPILPGIMIIQNAGGFKRMTGFCKTRVPPELAKKVDSIAGDDEAVKAYGVELATETCRKLIASGLVPGVHLYTLNLEKSVYGILDGLGLRASAAQALGDERENVFAGTTIGKTIK